jgi:hypothetical protein
MSSVRQSPGIRGKSGGLKDLTCVAAYAFPGLVVGRLEFEEFGGMIGAYGRGGGGMKLRIAIWSGLGALVVVVWRVYISVILSNPLGTGGVGRALIYLTCPISIASQHPQGFYFVLLMNAATYALVGSVVETMRRQYKPRLLSN